MNENPSKRPGAHERAGARSRRHALRAKRVALEEFARVQAANRQTRLPPTPKVCGTRYVSSVTIISREYFDELVR